MQNNIHLFSISRFVFQNLDVPHGDATKVEKAEAGRENPVLKAFVQLDKLERVELEGKILDKVVDNFKKSGLTIGNSTNYYENSTARLKKEEGVLYVQTGTVNRTFSNDCEFFCPFKITVDGDLEAPDGTILTPDGKKGFSRAEILKYATLWEKEATKKAIEPIKKYIDEAITILKKDGYTIGAEYATHGWDSKDLEYKIVAKPPSSKGKEWRRTVIIRNEPHITVKIVSDAPRTPGRQYAFRSSQTVLERG